MELEDELDELLELELEELELLLEELEEEELEEELLELELELLEELHRSGHTIVLITHDNAVAARAGRRVRMEDGVLREE